MLEEAQKLSAAALEEVRLLTCARPDTRAPFSLLLVGDDSLLPRLQMGINRALVSRLGFALALTRLEPAQSRDYVTARLRAVELLSGNYDCADRIVLNAYFRMGHTAGGFREWWGALTGSEETLDNAHLMRMAGRFSRRIHGYAKAQGIPLVHCQAGERKHELAEEYLAKPK